MNNILDSAIALIAGPRCGSSSIINYFVKIHNYKFEYCTVPTNKPKTIYLLRDVASFDQFNSTPHQTVNNWMENFIKLAKNDNIYTIALIRNPIEQLLSIYHKTIEKGGSFDKIKMPVSSSISDLIIYRRHNGIIHKSLKECDTIIDMCESPTKTISQKLNLNVNFIKKTEISGNRGRNFFKQHNLISKIDYDKLEQSQTMLLYQNLIKQ